MGVATGCGCKEVYRFPHTTYPYSSCICSFLQHIYIYNIHDSIDMDTMYMYIRRDIYCGVKYVICRSGCL